MGDCCLLCLEVKQSNEEFWDGIRADGSTWQEWNIKAILEKHFWPLKEILLPSSWICFKCWKNVRNFHKFYLRVEKAQKHAGKLRTIETALQSNDILEPEIVVIESFDEPDLETKLAKDTFEKQSQNSTEEKECNAQSITDDEEWDENEQEVSNSYGDCVKKSTNEEDSDFLIKEHFKKLICYLCEIELKDFIDVHKHFRSVHKEAGYLMCCNRKFHNRYRLVDHIHTHQSPKHFKCDECGRTLSNREKLRSHMVSVHPPVPIAKLNYPCDVCGETFSKANALRIHKNTHMPEEEKKFACSDCGQLFATLFQLNLHKNVSVLESLKIVCDICGLTLHTTTDHDTHMNKHADPVMKLDCYICGLRLTNESDLTLHRENDHPVYGKEDHKCPMCTKISPTMRALKTHISIMHDSGCKYKCSQCEKTFKRSASFKRHIASHNSREES